MTARAKCWPRRSTSSRRARRPLRRRGSRARPTFAPRGPPAARAGPSPPPRPPPPCGCTRARPRPLRFHPPSPRARGGAAGARARALWAGVLARRRRRAPVHARALSAARPSTLRTEERRSRPSTLKTRGGAPKPRSTAGQTTPPRRPGRTTRGFPGCRRGDNYENPDNNNLNPNPNPALALSVVPRAGRAAPTGRSSMESRAPRGGARRRRGRTGRILAHGAAAAGGRRGGGPCPIGSGRVRCVPRPSGDRPMGRGERRGHRQRWPARRVAAGAPAAGRVRTGRRRARARASARRRRAGGGGGGGSGGGGVFAACTISAAATLLLREFARTVAQVGGDRSVGGVRALGDGVVVRARARARAARDAFGKLDRLRAPVAGGV